MTDAQLEESCDVAQEAMLLTPQEWDDLEIIVGSYLNETRGLALLPAHQKFYGYGGRGINVDNVRRRRVLAKRIVEANRG